MHRTGPHVEGNLVRKLGLKAARIFGCCSICQAPRTAITTNQIKRIKPKTIPMPDVPLNCTANSAVSSPIVIGMTVCPKVGVATCSPSTADSTLIAGVIIPSAKSNPAPSIRTTIATPCCAFWVRPEGHKERKRRPRRRSAPAKRKLRI